MDVYSGIIQVIVTALVLLTHGAYTEGVLILEVPWSGVVEEDATLVCKYPGFDASMGYVWERNGKPILESNWKHIMTYTNHSFSLTIKELKPADEGVYECNYNFQSSNKADFRVESKAKRENINISSNNQHLYATVRKLYPAPSLTIKYVDGALIEGNLLRTTTDADGLFKLDWVSLEKLPAGKQTFKLTIKTRLQVDVIEEHTIKCVLILEVPWSGVVGEDATLVCKYPGFDASMGYVWERNGKPILESNWKHIMTYTNHSFSLTIKELKPADEGVYECNYNFQSSNKADFRVESKAKRENINISSNNQHLYATVRKLYPAPSLTIKYVDGALIEGNLLHTTTDADGLFKLDWVSLEKLPAGKQTFKLTIKTRLQVDVIEEHTIKCVLILEVPWSGVVGEDATLVCKYPGFDASRGYVWERNGKPILESNWKHIMTYTNHSFSLTIKELKPADEGVYKCNYNFHSSNKANFRVESKAKKENINISSNNQHLYATVSKLYPAHSLTIKYVDGALIEGNLLRTTTDADGLFKLDWVSLEKLPAGKQTFKLTIKTRLQVDVIEEHTIKSSTPTTGGSTSGQPPTCLHKPTVYTVILTFWYLFA